MKKRILMLAALVLILVCAVSVTMGYFHAETEPITNTFSAASVDIDVQEDTKGNAKTSITVENTGTCPAYVRVVIASFMTDEKGNPTEAAVVNPMLGKDWVLGGDGYYYYTAPIAAGETSGNMLKACLTMKNGQEIQVIADAVAATQVAEAWGFNPAATFGTK